MRLIGLVGIVQVTLEGVDGREFEALLVNGWYAMPERGDVGLRRPKTGESGNSAEGGFVALRESGVKRPFVLRLKKRGAVGDVVIGGEVGRGVWREVDEEELLRWIAEARLCVTSGDI